MKRKLAVLLLALTLLCLPCLAQAADMSRDKAWTAAQDIVSEYLDSRGATEFLFLKSSYTLHQDGEFYAVYGKVKYTTVDSIQRTDAFAVTFECTEDSVLPYMMMIGTKVLPSDYFVADMM